MTDWSLEIHNRLLVGPCIGFSIYPEDDDYGYSEFILFVLFISIHLKWS